MSEHIVSSDDTANNSTGRGAAIASDNSFNLLTVIKGLKKTGPSGIQDMDEEILRRDRSNPEGYTPTTQETEKARPCGHHCVRVVPEQIRIFTPFSSY